MIAVERLHELFGFEFSERQLAAITTPLEPSVIMAGAGSGKTSVMTARIVWLVANGIVEPSQVLGLTFTNKAAGEFRSRVRQALSQLELPPESADAAMITTYHAFAQQLLRDDGIRIGLEAEAQLLGDVRREQLARAVVRRPEVPIRALGAQSRSVVQQLLRLEDALAEEAIEPAALVAFDENLIRLLTSGPEQQKIGRDMLDTAAKRIELVALVEQFRRAKRDAVAIDYADMVRLALHLVRERDDVVTRLRDQHRIVLLDEYQDTSVAQRLLMSTAFGDGHAVTAVGDALQAIYEWRGASAQNIVDFPKHFSRHQPDGSTSPAVVHGLPTTQRFGSRIAALANVITDDLRNDLAGVEPLEAESDERYGPGSGVVALHADSSAEFGWLAEQLKREHEQTPWEQMAVLIRETRYAGEIYTALTAAGIPAQIVGKQGLLKIPDIAELVAYLRVINDPSANPSWVRIMSGLRYRIGVRDLAHLGQRAKQIAAGEFRERDNGWEEALAEAAHGADVVDLIALEDAMADPDDAPISAVARRRIAELRNEVRSLRRYAGLPVGELLRVIIRQIGLDVELAASDRAVERGRRAAIEQFIELASDFMSLDQSQGITAFLQWLADGDNLNRSATMQYPLRPDAVSIMTIHAAKGLQRDVIALPCWVEGSFPSLQSDGTWPRSATAVPFSLLQTSVAPELLEFPSSNLPRDKEFKAFQDACRPRNLAEETRLAYVAVTRARRRLIVSAARAYPGKPSVQPSRFLDPVREACANGFGEIAVWADEPADAQTVSPRTATFPAQLEPGYAQRLRDVIAMIEKPSTLVHALEPSDAATVAAWDAAIEHHLAERALQRTTVHDVPLPTTLTATQVQALRDDPDEFLLDLVRPLPKRPAPAASRGSAFHRWIEQFYGQQRLPLDDLLLDDDDADLSVLQAAFIASEWSRQEPIAQELPFAIGLGAHLVRGRIDAVYHDARGYVVVDWKTNARSAADPLQLAIYRRAVASIYGVPLDEVRSCFFYVARGETVWVDDDLDLAQVLGEVL